MTLRGAKGLDRQETRQGDIYGYEKGGRARRMRGCVRGRGCKDIRAKRMQGTAGGDIARHGVGHGVCEKMRERRRERDARRG